MKVNQNMAIILKVQFTEKVLINLHTSVNSVI